MKPRLAALLLLIVAMPLALLAAMGMLLAREEAAGEQNRSRQFMQGLLAEIDGQIARLLDARRRDCEKLAGSASLDPEALRELVRDDPRFRQIFVLGPDGRMVFPSATFGLTADETRFLERIGPVLQTGELAQLSSVAVQTAKQPPDVYQAQAARSIDASYGWSGNNENGHGWGFSNAMPSVANGAASTGNNEGSSVPNAQQQSGNAFRNLDNFGGSSVPNAQAQAASPASQTSNQVGWSVANAQQQSGPPNPQQQGGNLAASLSNVSPPPAMSGEANLSADAGWRSWYWGTGTHLIYWQRRKEGPSAGTVVGVELDRARLLSDVINLLPTTAATGKGDAAATALQGRIVLRGSNDEPLYQWGAYEPKPDEHATASLQLSPPLQSWRLTEIVKPELLAASGRSFFFSIAAGLVGSGALLILLAAYFFRESSREMREAGQRVNFVNQVSHELKTPLTNIRMYAELLEGRIAGGGEGSGREDEAEADPKARQYLDVIASESQRLSRLINNVLTLGRAGRQGLVLHPQRCRPDAIVAATAEHFRPAFERKRLAIETELNGGPEGLFDPDAIEQILGNLFSNVEKYGGEAGKVRVASRRENGAVVVEVADEGPGIPAGEAEKIFMPFYRVSNKLSDGVSGTGIGLSIARDLARLHGGDLMLVKSARGACFELRLAPLDGSNAGEAPAAKEEGPS